MQVKHAVITSVNRDELKDKGAEIWYQTVVSVKNLCPTTTIETLIPDVKADWSALDRMITGGQELVSHNLETVRSLYRRVRPQAKYDRSLEQIKRTKEAGLRTKSGIMLGLGETKDEVLVAMDDLRANSNGRHFMGHPSIGRAHARQHYGLCKILVPCPNHPLCACRPTFFLVDGDFGRLSGLWRMDFGCFLDQALFGFGGLDSGDGLLIGGFLHLFPDFA